MYSFGDVLPGLYLRWWLLPAKQWADGDDNGEDPHAQHGKQSPLLCDNCGVLQWPANTNVAVDGDDAQGHYRSSAAQDIHRGPDVTEDPTKHPIIQDLQGQSQNQGTTDSVT